MPNVRLSLLWSLARVGANSVAFKHGLWGQEEPRRAKSRLFLGRLRIPRLSAATTQSADPGKERPGIQSSSP